MNCFIGRRNIIGRDLVLGLAGVPIGVIIILHLLGIRRWRWLQWQVQWPFLGWGLGILGHAIGVFMPINRVGRDWEERKIKERLAKM